MKGHRRSTDSHQGNTSQHYNENATSHPLGWLQSKGGGRSAEKLEPSYTAGENIIRCFWETVWQYLER